MTKRKLAFSLSLFCMSLGGGIYILFRDDSLILFQWARHLGMFPLVQWSRTLVEGVEPSNWMLYSLPDGLWLLSLMVFLSAVWNFEQSRRCAFYLALAPLMALAYEGGQALGCLSGTFDIWDVFAYLSATFIGFSFYKA